MVFYPIKTDVFAMSWPSLNHVLTKMWHEIIAFSMVNTFLRSRHGQDMVKTIRQWCCLLVKKIVSLSFSDFIKTFASHNTHEVFPRCLLWHLEGIRGDKENITPVLEKLKTVHELVFFIYLFLQVQNYNLKCTSLWYAVQKPFIYIKA